MMRGSSVASTTEACGLLVATGAAVVLETVVLGIVVLGIVVLGIVVLGIVVLGIVVLETVVLGTGVEPPMVVVSHLLQ
jgi:hypothetical protein